MNYDSKNYFIREYYEQLLQDVRVGVFIDKDTDYLPLFQVGVYIIERVDVTLEGNFDEGFRELLIELFLETVRKFPGEVGAHLGNTIGAFPYTGIFDSGSNDIINMWQQVKSMMIAGKNDYLYELSCLILDNEGSIFEAADIIDILEEGFVEEQVSA